MRRSSIALAVLVTALLLGAASAGPSIASSLGPLSASSDPLTFGNVAVGDQQTSTVTLTNNGGGTLTMGSSTANGDFNVSNDNCQNQVLNPNDSCTVSVTLQPSSTGSIDGTLTINDDDPSSPQTLDMHGNGIEVISVDQTSLDFGSLRVNSTSASLPVTVTNNSSSPANPTGPSVTGDFGIAANTCPSTLPGSSTCTINIDFTPSTTGTRNGTLQIDGHSISLTGQGIQPGASLTPGSFGFGNQPLHTPSTVKSFTLTNTGSAALNYTGVTKGGANPGDFSVGDQDCSSKTTLAPNATCTITVQFNPTATGKRTASFTVHDDAPGATQTASLSGTGTPSSVGFVPSSVTFTKPIPAGTASPGHVVTVANRTSSNMPITSIAIGGANPKSFAHGADTCTGANLAPNAKCTITVRFTPVDAGERTAFLEINDGGSVAPHTHSLTLTGTATYPHDPKGIYGSVGCAAAQIHWIAPTSSRFAGTIVVRNHSHSPTNPSDGKRLTHPAGVAVDKGLQHFSTYYYRVFAKYHSLTRKGAVNYSQGARLRKRTGEICTPQDGSRIHDTSPTLTWLSHATQNGYAFVLQRGEATIWINYTNRTHWQMPSAWRYKSNAHRLIRGRTYTFFLYAYPKAHPKGLFIGKTTFTIV
jgi:archaellum component FlaF (FlaF/FlaG flagellin family)